LKVAVISLFPEMFDALSKYGVSGRAFDNGLIKLRFYNPRNYADDPHQCVDSRPYGGGPGMVMMAEPLSRALADAKGWMGPTDHSVVYMSPQGKVLKQKHLKSFSSCEGFILVAGRYEGVDERFIKQEVDEEWSIGDYVLSGGELPAMVVLDALIRNIPGALGHAQSAEEGSFSQGLLGHPQYTRPDSVAGEMVPTVLLSGNHEQIRLWRLKCSLKRTRDRRPELLDAMVLNLEQTKLLDAMDEDFELKV
jgi:tRNA (guanine37-N1)-methyltransferase